MKREIEDVSGYQDGPNGSPSKSKPPINGIERTITPIGDTSADKDDKPDSENFVEKLNQFKNKEEFLLTFEEVKEGVTYKQTFNISDSCILKEIGDQVLRNKTVRDKYREIKRKLLPEDKREKCENFKDRLGQGWDILVINFFFNDHYWTRRETCEKYFSLNRNKIEEMCNGDEIYHKLMENHEKGEYYLLKIALDYFCLKIRNFSPQEKMKMIEARTEELGDGWHNVVDEYPRITQATLKTYHEKNKDQLESMNSNNYYRYRDHKWFYYISNKVIEDFRDEIHELNKEISAEPFRRNLTAPVSLDFSQTDEPGSYLARLLASLKLDRDLVVNTLYDIKVGKCQDEIAIQTYCTTVEKVELQTYKNQTLSIYKNSRKFFQWMSELRDYTSISEKLKKLLDSDNVTASEMKTMMQSYFRGEKIDVKVRSFLEKYKDYIELMFGVEVIRNSSALLTHAMFFDLLIKKVYTLEDLPQKLPMSMREAITASFVITRKMGKEFYDFRYEDCRDYALKSAANLTKLNQAILFDWLEQNIINEFEKRNISYIRAEDTISKVLDLQKAEQNLNFLDFSGYEPNQKISDKEVIIHFHLPYYSGTLRIVDLENRNFKIVEITEVSGKVFYNLILDWYNIHVMELNKEDKIKFDFAVLKSKEVNVLPDEIDNNNDQLKLGEVTNETNVLENAEALDHLKL